jgi:hypothetical protein
MIKLVHVITRLTWLNVSRIGTLPQTFEPKLMHVMCSATFHFATCN